MRTVKFCPEARPVRKCFSEIYILRNLNSHSNSGTVTCNSKLGYVPSISTLSCPSDARQNDAVVIPQCVGMPCNVTAPLNGAIGSCPPMLASGLSCTPTCNEGYVQQGTNLQLVCERGVITSNIVCEAIPEEEEGTVVLAPFVIPMTIWTVSDAEEDGGGGGDTGWRVVVVTVVMTRHVMHLRLIRIRKLL